LNPNDLFPFRLQEKVERLTGQFVRSKWGGLLQANSPISVATENQAVQTDPQKHRDGSSSDDEDERKRNGGGMADVSDMFSGLEHTKSKIASRRRRAKNESKNRYGCFSGMLDTGEGSEVSLAGVLTSPLCGKIFTLFSEARVRVK
jgi:hypothetical protein